MGFIFGPVPSQRLGQSLGIDPLPLKVCNWNCIYCQLGRTVPLSNERREFFPREEILAEAGAVLGCRPRGDIDWVTFCGSGETTLHTGLGWMIRKVKGLTDLPVAVITNGSLLHRPEVRQDLRDADAILSALDAGTPALYRRINRSWPALNFELLVQGLIAFRREFVGKLWIKVMLLKGINDSEEALGEIAGVLDRIDPDDVHIGLPTRPPAEPEVSPPGEDSVYRAAKILGKRARVVQASRGTFDLSGHGSAANAILAIIARHPMSEEELRGALQQWSPGQVDTALQQLAAGGDAQVVERNGKRFWSASACCFPAWHVSVRKR